MPTEIQVALISGFFVIVGYIISSVQKTVDRFLSQKHFQKSALGILKDIHGKSTRLDDSVERMVNSMESQSDLMDKMLSYAKQNAEAANQMAKIVEMFINGRRN
jgi:methyl-accepting chemotaxis protein